jgi:hypothetical protein
MASLASLVEGASRRPYAYATSHPLEELELEGARLLLKDLRRPPASKPGFLHDPHREIEAYLRILEPARLGTPRLRAASDGLLLFEKVDGVELWQVEEVEVWQRVARWLARAHNELARHEGEAFLLRYDARWYRLWLQRAKANLDGLATLEPAYDVAVRRLLALPRTVIHGEFYASNILVDGERVCAVDWEMAAAGPGVIDLAALVTGWGAKDAAAIAERYGKVDPVDLDCARLHLAVRWLGWEPAWTPPLEHARDWLADALDAARRLEERLL